MNISCEIIKDLLPLYHDGVCSKDSKDMVEEHLQQCESCRSELQAMDNELLITNRAENLAEAEVVQKLSKSWRKGMIKSVLKGVFFTLVTVIVILLIIYIFVGIKIA
ncbi:zf-HC2 domain-containing protein [Anaerosacchariphilus polymeriproducens]|uniref:Anti-sigma-W factor RsiW n=1 Tax=Anaerosacchariphilus polymeriproducens TaxID=1812858 RepID=A0A371AVY9_9FIRM|nr:zf-HC2 domain-containing protein [Anaerosacchariphilus polymeriproducens]RDU23702.1 zf-HC2 domain-containing protein [Anaerosacchariphilus polymeriproducens]